MVIFFLIEALVHGAYYMREFSRLTFSLGR
jgi:hypothetical protein